MQGCVVLCVLCGSGGGERGCLREAGAWVMYGGSGQGALTSEDEACGSCDRK